MTDRPKWRFNTPPGWPTPPDDWMPTEGWAPDPSWPPAPAGWTFWLPNDDPVESDHDPVEPSETDPSLPSDSDEASDSNDYQAEIMTLRAELSETKDRLSQSEVALGERERDLENLRQATEDTRRESQIEQERESRIATLTREAAELEETLATSKAELVELNDAALLQQVGIYDYHHPLENADAYKERLANLKERIKEAVRDRGAIEASDRFAYNNSLAQGRRMTADLSKLMLRAYNAEADSCVRSLRAGSIDAAVKRLDKAREAIAKLGSMMEMHVGDSYHGLRIEELELTSDYLFKVQEEREAAREERERIREEKRAEAELAAERERLDKERAHYANTLAHLKSDNRDEDEIAAVQARLDAIDGAIEQNDYRAANIRAGYVYVISNIGSFGPDVVKIGMTRRLDPMDRVRELGDASVPFTFDVHALFFADDAVAVENDLHQAFTDARLNKVNQRKEFFFATPAQVRDVLVQKVGNLLDFTEDPEASHYFQSRSAWPSRTR